MLLFLPQWTLPLLSTSYLTPTPPPLVTPMVELLAPSLSQRTPHLTCQLLRFLPQTPTVPHRAVFCHHNLTQMIMTPMISQLTKLHHCLGMLTTHCPAMLTTHCLAMLTTMTPMTFPQTRPKMDYQAMVILIR